MELKNSQAKVKPQEAGPQDPSRRRFLGHGAVLAAGAIAATLEPRGIFGTRPVSASNPPAADPLRPGVNVLVNPSQEPFKATSELLTGKERDEVLKSFKAFLQAGFTDGGIQVLRNRDWLREDELIAKKDVTRDGGSVSLYYDETPHFSIYTKQNELSPEGFRKTIEQAKFNTGYIGDDKMDQFRDEIQPLMKDQEANFEAVPFTEPVEDSQPVLTANKNQIDGGGSFDYVAELTPVNRLARDDQYGEFGAVDLSLRLKNEGVLSLEQTVVYTPNPQKGKI